MIRPRGSRSILLIAAVTAVLAGCAPEAPAPERTPNVVLLTVDTLRADHLEAHGYARATAPGISALAGAGVHFEHAVAQAPWTLPSVASIQTSLYPSQHSAVEAESRLPEEARTLAEMLQSFGYKTVGVVSHQFVSRKHGLSQGFEIFDETNLTGHAGVTSEELTRTSLALLAEESEPFFLWVHYFDPHFAYVRHPDFGFADGYEGPLPDRISASRLNRRLEGLAERGRQMGEKDVQYVEAVYDEEIAFTDRWISVLWEQLIERYSAENTLLILTSDHGEYFLERGRFFHGKDVYEPLVHVPLVVGGAIEADLLGTTVGQTVEIRSIPATVMGLLGIDDHGFSGQDLLQIARGSRALPAFTEGSYAFGADQRKHAVVLEGWKLIRNLDDDSYELYELSTDPGEQNNRWETESRSRDGIAPTLHDLLREFASSAQLGPHRLELSPEERRRLKSLGYVQ